MKTPPIVSAELIKYLQECYPDVHPDENARKKAIRHKGGQLSVVRHLKRLHEEQNTLTKRVTK